MASPSDHAEVAQDFGDDVAPLTISVYPGALGITYTHEGEVLSVVPGGQADRAGVKSGMRIISIGGKPYDNALLALTKYSAGLYFLTFSGTRGKPVSEFSAEFEGMGKGALIRCAINAGADDRELETAVYSSRDALIELNLNMRAQRGGASSNHVGMTNAKSVSSESNEVNLARKSDKGSAARKSWVLPHRYRYDASQSQVFSMDGMEVKMCIDMHKVKSDFRRFKVISRGYTGLCSFVLFVLAYVYCISTQHDALHVGDVNGALQAFIDKQKGDLQIQDSASLYSFMSKTIVPAFLQSRWSNITADGRHFSGHTTNDFYHVVGGVVLTGVKSQVGNCRYNKCYLPDHLNEPFDELLLPGGNVTFAVPYNSNFQGYSLSIPSSADPVHINSLLLAYGDFFGPETRELRMNVVLFNPSGTKTLTFLEFAAKIGTDNRIRLQTAIKTIPYYWYQPSTKYWQLAIELAVAVWYLALICFPVLYYMLKRVDDAHDPHDMQRWIRKWEHLPQVGGRPLLHAPLAMIALLNIAVLLWLYLGSLYGSMIDFQRSRWLFEDFSTAATLPELLQDALNFMHIRHLPLSNDVALIASLTEWYFFVQVLVFGCILWRLQGYLLFQSRLSMVWTTFQGIYDDLIHICLVLCLVCFILGVINSCAFGEVDEVFQDTFSSFLAMLGATLIEYKPAADQPFVQSLIKYSPHVLRTDSQATWLPLVVWIVFKVLLPLLLLKLLMGVIMEGYKKTRPREDIPTLREDLAFMFRMGMARFHSFRKGYVPFIHVALAIANYQRQLEEINWEQGEEPSHRYLGLGSSGEVLEALNSIDEETSEYNNLKECDDEELRYVLETYGVERQNARIQHAVDAFNHVDCEEAMQLNNEDEADEIVKARSKQWHRQSNCVRFLSSEQKVRFDQRAKKLFNDYDFAKIGTVDIRCISTILRRLGFRIRPSHAAQLLAQYDDNGDGDVSLKEFNMLIRDNALLGHFMPSDMELRETSFPEPSSSSLMSAHATTPLLGPRG